MKHARTARIKRLLAFLVPVLVVMGVAAAFALRASASGISVDASSPASVLETNSTAATEVTATFSPPAGSYVVATFAVGYDRNTPSGPSVTASDSLGSAYTAGPQVYDGAGEGSFIFAHYYAAAPGAITLTVTRSGSNGQAMLELDTLVLDGAAPSQAGAASAAKTSHGSKSYTAAITTTQAGSWAVAAATTGREETLTPHDLVNYHIQSEGNDAMSSGTGYAVTGSPGAETIGWTGSSTYYSIAELEVLPAGTSPSPSPTSTSPSPSPTMTSPSPSPTMTSPSPSPTTSSPPPPGPLTWSPPACGGADGDQCVTINLSAGGSQNPSLAANTDYKLVMPSTPIAGGTLTISGGHNVQIIGGEIDLNNPCSDSCSAEGDGAIYITDPNPGEVYIEGVLIHNTQTAADTGPNCPGGGDSCSTADGIDLNVGDGGNPPNPPSIVLQNIRIDGISGCSGGPDHADGYQPYNGGTSTSYIDHMTITTNCQGEELDPDYGYSHYGTKPNYVLKNVNVDVLPNPYKGNVDEYGYYLSGVGSGCPSGNVSLTNVYEQEPSGSIDVNSVWPDTNSSCASSYDSATGQMTFPHSPQITGMLSNGLPPGGDFVPAGVAGIGYVSPGYQQ